MNLINVIENSVILLILAIISITAYTIFPVSIYILLACPFIYLVQVFAFKKSVHFFLQELSEDRSRKSKFHFRLLALLFIMAHITLILSSQQSYSIVAISLLFILASLAFIIILIWMKQVPEVIASLRGSRFHGNTEYLGTYDLWVRRFTLSLGCLYLCASVVPLLSGNREISVFILLSLAILYPVLLIICSFMLSRKIGEKN